MRKLFSRTTLFILCALMLFAALSPAFAQNYGIKAGDSLWAIALRFGVTVHSLQVNNEISGSLIVAGHSLNIPRIHNVQRGESLFLLARNYNTTSEALMEINNMSGHILLAGQRLFIPTGSSAPVAVHQAHRIADVTDEEMVLLARTVYSEARGEPFEGQVAVAAVVLNRVRHPQFPNSISGVIFEPWAFTAVHDGQFWLTPNETAYRAVGEALAGSDPSQGAIFYYNPVTATNRWIRSRSIITKIGRHLFAR